MPKAKSIVVFACFVIVLALIGSSGLTKSDGSSWVISGVGNDAVESEQRDSISSGEEKQQDNTDRQISDAGERSKPTTTTTTGVKETSGSAQRSTNPHIVDLEFTDEELTSSRTARTKTALAVDKMRAACAKGLPGMQQPPWTTRRGIPTMYNDQAYLYQHGLVCYDDRTRWYYDGEKEAEGLLNNGDSSDKRELWGTPRSLQWALNRAAFEMKPTAKLHSIYNNSEFVDSFSRTLESKRFYFHQSLAILSVGAWGTVSIYHFLMDLLMGMTSLIMSNPELETFPRDVVQMHENHIMKIEKWNLPPCFECLAVAPIVTDNIHQPNITISFTGPVDSSMRCFCGMVLVHHQTLTNRAQCCSRPMTTQTHVGDVMVWIKQRLIEKWRFRPFGELVEYGDYAKYGYWLNATNPRKPRLLFLLRTKSRYIGRVAELMQAARDLGFAVHSMAFETETMERQMAAGRYADVVLGTHGAALTSLVMMDTSGSRMLCRSLIEMFHWAPLGRIVHYQKMAYMVNVSALGVIPVDVAFGKSVANPRKERKLLKSFSYTWSGTGFHDQTAYYNTNTFRERLGEAIRNLRNCPDVDLSDMKMP